MAMKDYDENDFAIMAQYMGDDMLSWSLTIISLYGAYLNLKKNPFGFILWAIADVCWFLYDISIQEYAQAILFLIYFFLAVWGFAKWQKEEVEKRNDGKSQNLFDKSS